METKDSTRKPVSSLNEEKKPPKYTVVKPKFELYVFTGSTAESKYVFQLTDLSLAMVNPHERQPLSTQLMGDFSDISSKQIASKLTKILRKVVFLSCNTTIDKVTQSYVLSRIKQEINLNPNKF